jgi:hypothetical protein
VNKWRSGLYRNANDCIIDVLTANINVIAKLLWSKDGVRVAVTSDDERAIQLEEQAAAIARLTVDAAITK